MSTSWRANSTPTYGASARGGGASGALGSGSGHPAHPRTGGAAARGASITVWTVARGLGIRCMPSPTPSRSMSTMAMRELYDGKVIGRSPCVLVIAAGGQPYGKDCRGTVPVRRRCLSNFRMSGVPRSSRPPGNASVQAEVVLAFPQHHSMWAACRRASSQSLKRMSLMTAWVWPSSRAGMIARTRIRAWPVSPGTGPTN